MLTCSRTLHTLLPNPLSLKNRSYIKMGGSRPLPLPILDADGEERNASPPMMTSVSRALSRAFSRASPSRSNTPGEGRKAVMTCRSMDISWLEPGDEDVDDEAENGRPLELGVTLGRDIMRGRRGGRAESVAVVRC